jgi:hypothetical protein
MQKMCTLRIARPGQPRMKVFQQRNKMKGRFGSGTGFSSLRQARKWHPSSSDQDWAGTGSKKENQVKNSTYDVLIGSGQISFMCALFHSGVPGGELAN